MLRWRARSKSTRRSQDHLDYSSSLNPLPRLSSLSRWLLPASSSAHATHGFLVVLVEFRGKPMASGDDVFAPAKRAMQRGWDTRGGDNAALPGTGIWCLRPYMPCCSEAQTDKNKAGWLLCLKRSAEQLLMPCTGLIAGHLLISPKGKGGEIWLSA